jgi:hypothetical protein
MPVLGSQPPEQSALGVVDVQRGEVGHRPLPGVLELAQAGPAGSGRDELVATEQRLELALLIGGDHVVARVKELALPAALVEIQDPAGLLGEVPITREDPRAPRPRTDRVLGQIAPHRGARDRAHDPARDRLVGDLSGRPARQRPARLGRKLARQRLDLGDLSGGKTTADDPAAASHPSPECPPRNIVAATCPPTSRCNQAAERSPRWSAPRWPTTRSSRAAPHDATACTARHADAAHAPRPRSARSGTCWPLPTRFAALAMTPSTNHERISGIAH